VKPPTLLESTAGAHSGWWLKKKISWKRWVCLELANWQHLDNRSKRERYFKWVGGLRKWDGARHI